LKGKQQDGPVGGLAPEQHEADCEPHAGVGDKQDGGDRAVAADLEVGAEDHEREEENGDPEHPGEDEPVPVQACASLTLLVSAHTCLSWCRWKIHASAPAQAHRPNGETERR